KGHYPRAEVGTSSSAIATGRSAAALLPCRRGICMRRPRRGRPREPSDLERAFPLSRKQTRGDADRHQRRTVLAPNGGGRQPLPIFPGRGQWAEGHGMPNPAGRKRGRHGPGSNYPSQILHPQVKVPCCTPRHVRIARSNSQQNLAEALGPPRIHWGQGVAHRPLKALARPRLDERDRIVGIDMGESTFAGALGVPRPRPQREASFGATAKATTHEMPVSSNRRRPLGAWGLGAALLCDRHVLLPVVGRLHVLEGRATSEEVVVRRQKGKGEDELSGRVAPSALLALLLLPLDGVREPGLRSITTVIVNVRRRGQRRREAGGAPAEMAFVIFRVSRMGAGSGWLNACLPTPTSFRGFEMARDATPTCSICLFVRVPTGDDRHSAGRRRFLGVQCPVSTGDGIRVCLMDAQTATRGFGQRSRSMSGGVVERAECKRRDADPDGPRARQQDEERKQGVQQPRFTQRDAVRAAPPLHRLHRLHVVAHGQPVPAAGPALAADVSDNASNRKSSRPVEKENNARLKLKIATAARRRKDWRAAPRPWVSQTRPWRRREERVQTVQTVQSDDAVPPAARRTVSFDDSSPAPSAAGQPKAGIVGRQRDAVMEKSWLSEDSHVGMDKSWTDDESEGEADRGRRQGRRKWTEWTECDSIRMCSRPLSPAHCSQPSAQYWLAYRISGRCLGGLSSRRRASNGQAPSSAEVAKHRTVDSALRSHRESAASSPSQQRPLCCPVHVRPARPAQGLSRRNQRSPAHSLTRPPTGHSARQIAPSPPLRSSSKSGIPPRQPSALSRWGPRLSGKAAGREADRSGRSAQLSFWEVRTSRRRSCLAPGPPRLRPATPGAFPEPSPIDTARFNRSRASHPPVRALSLVVVRPKRQPSITSSSGQVILGNAAAPSPVVHWCHP
ncbi:hypothetical protein EJ04DRAFT_606538, partial [Polyplosphaeria fusca]